MSLKALLTNILTTLKALRDWYQTGDNKYIYTAVPNAVPSGGSSYGRTMRLGGTSLPGSAQYDTYYIRADSNGYLWVGTQLNGATAITWRKIG